MSDLIHFCKQSWLAHRELGLTQLVEAEMWVTAAFVACWIFVRLLRRTDWITPVRRATARNRRVRTAIRLPSLGLSIEQRRTS